MAVYGAHAKTTGRRGAASAQSPVYAQGPGQGGAGPGNGYSQQQGDGNGYHGGGGNGYGGNGYGGNGYGNGGGEPPRDVSAKEQLYEVLHVVFKRWRLIAGLFIAVALPGIMVTASQDRRFAASGKVLISSERAGVTIQPTEEDSLATIKLNEAIVNSEVHIIRSRELMKQVAERLQLAQVGGDVVRIANAATEREEIARRADRIARRLRVTPVRNSNIIEIRFESGDPDQAAQVVNRVIDEYLSFTAMVHGDPGLADFYADQGQQLQEQLRGAEKELSDFAYRNGLVAPEAELQASIAALNDISSTLRSRNATIVATEARLQALREQLAEQPTVVKRAQHVEVNPVVRQLRSQLADREVDRVALLRKYTENHRYVQDNAAEIDEIRGQLEMARVQEPTEVTMEIFAANPVYEVSLNSLLDLEAKLRESKAHKLALEEDLEQSRRRLVALKQNGLEYERLDRNVRRIRGAVELYSKREQEARIENAMDRARLVNVQVVERAGRPLNRVDSKKAPLMLAILSGLAVSLGGAFGYEYVNRTLRFEREVERYLGLPVLGTVKDSGEV